MSDQRFAVADLSGHGETQAMAPRARWSSMTTQTIETELRAGAPPTVSVVIPCFNYAHFLEGAVTSAVTQQGVDVDVIIVDDCSTDDSLAVARRLATQHPNVQVRAHETNTGPVGTFNDGLKLARGEFLVRLDADDMLTPGALQRATSLMRAHPNVGLVYGHPQHFQTEPRQARTNVRSWTVWPGLQWLANRCHDGLSVITSPEVVMRTSVVDRVGGQQPLRQSHDTEMWNRIAAFSDVGRVNGVDQAFHRDHPNGWASEVTHVSDLFERADMFDTLFRGVAGTLPEAPALELVARRAIAREALVDACHQIDRGRATAETVTALQELARERVPDAENLPEWRQLQRRAALGPRAARRPWYAAAALRRRLGYERSRRRWARTGLFHRALSVEAILRGSSDSLQ